VLIIFVGGLSTGHISAGLSARGGRVPGNGHVVPGISYCDPSSAAISGSTMTGDLAGLFDSLMIRDQNPI
jgi:hypothetical protein